MSANFSCYAQAAETGGGAPEFGAASMGFRVVVYLILIIGLFFLIVKYLAKKNRSFSSGGHSLKSWGGVPVGQGKSVQVIQVGRSLYVVGVGQDVQLLDKIDDPDEVERIQTNSLSQQTFDWKGLPGLSGWKDKLEAKRAGRLERDMSPEELSFGDLFQKQLQDAARRKKELGKRLEEEINEDRLNDTK
ncbi:hypothetical protein J31TS4_01030 [Paenibacillus sp. J31TS4]|nr:hypothetical protein J31TS4_01030 [Paenibacillus sp. J31TS4]